MAGPHRSGAVLAGALPAAGQAAEGGRRRSTARLLPFEAKSSALGNSGSLKAPAVRNALAMGLQEAPTGRDVHNLWS